VNLIWNSKEVKQKTDSNSKGRIRA